VNTSVDPPSLRSLSPKKVNQGIQCSTSRVLDSLLNEAKPHWRELSTKDREIRSRIGGGEPAEIESYSAMPAPRENGGKTHEIVKDPCKFRVDDNIAEDPR